MGEPPILLHPDPSHWPRRLAGPTPAAARFRDQLGLPPGPLVMSGHQAEFWHMGILAKWFAAAAAARRAGAAWAWVVVDQDDNDPWRLRLPVRCADARLAEAAWTADPLAEPPAGRGTGFRPALAEVAPLRLAPGQSPATSSVAEGWEALARALAAQRGAPSAAAQVTGATLDLLAGLPAPAAVVYASDLARTDLFAEWADAARRDAGRLAECYNAAAAASPRAGVRPLARDGERGWEVPWWRIGPGGRRAPAFAADLAGAGLLAPRALLMTAMLRVRGCDLFVHGTGGGVYDAVTERWIAAWLGERSAPAAVASATRRLPLAGEAPAPEEIARLRHHAHAAAHNPALLGDAEAGAMKAALLARVRTRDRAARREAYRRMHEALREWRRRRAADLEALRRRAADAAARAGEARVAHDRTWAFPLHPRAAVGALAAEVIAAFAG